MTGRLYIDNLDAWPTYGVCIAEGGLADLVTIPAFKDLSVNDWAESDGEEADLSAPVLPSRMVTLPFIAKGLSGFTSLLNVLSDGVYHTFIVASIGQSFKLRLTNMPSYVSVRDLGLISLRFANDFPPVAIPEGLTDTEITEFEADYDSATPFLNESPLSSAPIRTQGYSIDGVDLSQFGVWLLEGSDESIRRAPDVKLALNRSSSYKDGMSYDSGATVRYAAKDVTLNLFIRSASIEDFWNRWNALHTSLLRSGERSVTYAETGETNTAYFKGSRVTTLEPDGRGGLWCEFRTTLRYTDARPGSGSDDGDVDYAVLTEDGYVLVTEDGDYITVE